MRAPRRLSPNQVAALRSVLEHDDIGHHVKKIKNNEKARRANAALMCTRLAQGQARLHRAIQTQQAIARAVALGRRGLYEGLKP